MFNSVKKMQFATVGELRALLANLPDNTPVTICGDNLCYYHEELDQSAVCLDCEALEECYGDNSISSNDYFDVPPESAPNFGKKENGKLPF